MAMLVRKEFRRRGIGTGLLKTLLRDARKMGIKVLKRSVMAGNTPAIKLYPKLGFKSCDRVCGASKYKNRYVDEIIMVRRM
jgi:ribosomal protein S18 acetylase RimI-like enzyme